MTAHPVERINLRAVRKTVRRRPYQNNRFTAFTIAGTSASGAILKKEAITSMYPGLVTPGDFSPGLNSKNLP